MVSSTLEIVLERIFRDNYLQFKPTKSISERVFLRNLLFMFGDVAKIIYKNKEDFQKFSNKVYFVAKNLSRSRMLIFNNPGDQIPQNPRNEEDLHARCWEKWDKSFDVKWGKTKFEIIQNYIRSWILGKGYP